MADAIFPDGMRLWEPREGAPSFVKGSLSIHLDTFSAWAMEHLDDKGYLRLDLKEGRDTKLYLSLNTYKKGAAPEVEEPKDEINPDDIPF